MSQTLSGPLTLRRRFVVRGVVQGVGFRPFVARLARELGLSGSCHNAADRVVVVVEGHRGDVDTFAHRLVSELPPLASIVLLESADEEPCGTTEFVIEASQAGGAGRTLVPPDVATCADCLAELADPSDRRFGHPFITCTNCGPRFSIITDLPYDRPATTMADFPMCDACAAEYADPQDRRYHAQPIGCHDCGPTLSWDDPTSTTLVEQGLSRATRTCVVVRAAREALLAGRIVAIKGIGGFHLACAADNATAVATLRSRKQRPDQPFAVMAATIEVAARLIKATPEGRLALTSSARPILLADKGIGAQAYVCDEVAPGLPTLGVMLPYTPLHALLLDHTLPAMVLTSGNVSGEPLCIDNAEARDRLAGIADAFLMHDRAIEVPVEDSVLMDGPTGIVPVRRSRGYAPLPVAVPDAAQVVLAAGAEIKNTVALARDGLAFVSAHVGDLGTLESQRAHDRAVEQLVRFHQRRPTLVVADLHPGYASTSWAQRYAAAHEIELLQVQHHHAHLAALAAEHGRLDEPLIGLVFDGTGFGCNGTIWGGEILELTAHGATAVRHGHLGTLPLPGGDGAVRNPARLAAAALLSHGVELTSAPTLLGQLTDAEMTALPGLTEQALAQGNITSSVGRLFDIVSALLGVRGRISYEAQAAIELENLAAQHIPGSPPAPRLVLPIRPGQDSAYVMDPGPMLRTIVAAQAQRVRPAAIAYAFHDALAHASATAAAAIARERGQGTIGLTGGVFANRLLLAQTTSILNGLGLSTVTHRLVPANDGGLALGQVAVGLAHITQRSA